MSNKTPPIFPISEPRHYNDYGFHPQVDYFEVLEEAKRHKKKNNDSPTKSNENVDVQLQNRVPESESIAKQNKKRWWKKNPLLFFRWKRQSKSDGGVDRSGGGGVHVHRVSGVGLSKSGPVYITESRSGSSTPYRNSYSPIAIAAGSMSPAQMPYVSLREFNVDQQQQQHCRMSTSAMPIYLVT